MKLAELGYVWQAVASATIVVLKLLTIRFEMGDETIEYRRKQILELKTFVDGCEEKCLGILEEFEWTKEKLMESGCRTQQPSREKQERADLQWNINHLTQGEKLRRYEEATRDSKRVDSLNAIFAESDMGEFPSSSRSKQTGLVDMNKLKRDLKRRRVKYRTTKAPPLTYSEELRELIQLQMETVRMTR